MQPPTLPGRTPKRIPLTVIGNSLYARVRLRKLDEKVSTHGHTCGVGDDNLVDQPGDPGASSSRAPAPAPPAVPEEQLAAVAQPPAEEAQAVALQPAVLGSDSRIDDMKARLKELKGLGVPEAAVHGSKKKAWGRLVDCEAKYKEVLAKRAGLEERRQAIEAGAVPRRPETL